MAGLLLIIRIINRSFVLLPIRCLVNHEVRRCGLLLKARVGDNLNIGKGAIVQVLEYPMV